jgi:hypothetical protein
MTRCLVLLLSCLVFGYGQVRQKMEPPDGRIIHGLGQYEGFYYNDNSIWQDNKDYETAAGQIPLIYSAYSFIDPLIAELDPTDFEDIVSNHDYPYLLLIGVILVDSQFATSGTFNLHVESIINGSLDPQIITLANRIKNIDAPVFIRPGFEFGVNNSGFHNDPDLGADDFKKIWIHIYNIFDEQNVSNIAWVWNTVNPSSFNYMDWYPGDQYVDWWGVNFFTAGQIGSSDGFIANAEMHNKPVMICESSPITSNGTLNTNNWNNWFLPYFNKIKSQRQIKAFVYINSPWSEGPFSGWPESRITENETISSNYKQQLQDSVFIHMDEYLSNPELITAVETPFRIPVTTDLGFNSYPNPFNAVTKITWQSSGYNPVKVNIYNVLGEIVASFAIKNVHPGRNEILWDAGNLPSGTYYARLIMESMKKAIIIMNLIK